MIEIGKLHFADNMGIISAVLAVGGMVLGLFAVWPLCAAVFATAFICKSFEVMELRNKGCVILVVKR